jgi:hypothetical protein
VSEKLPHDHGVTPTRGVTVFKQHDPKDVSSTILGVTVFKQHDPKDVSSTILLQDKKSTQISIDDCLLLQVYKYGIRGIRYMNIYFDKHRHVISVQDVTAIEGKK